ncbi:sigma 54-interacting transcriptional regulator [uncultured Propionivibrio sp.]|uniref:sigma 54-interacting transcriptional regulator n=1 Tax=uncultured Propionivibrio sp. TaxID=426737 RepID=UPI0029C0904F|nr:sigma 54-interacting transcriptional regulator [uncultured Propionivibrio sp.]
MKEIVVVAPIRSLADLAGEIVADAPFDNVGIVPGTLADGVAAARAAIEQGARIVVSRGGTYDQIKAEVAIPVVEIKVSAFDLIESLKKVRQQGRDELIGIVGHRNVISGADIVADAMGLRSVSVEVDSRSDIAVEVDQLIRLGVGTFVGNSKVEAEARRRGCSAVWVQSGRRAIREAIDEAQQILRAAWQQKERAQQFATIIDFVHDGIVAIDRAGAVTVFNSASEKITGVGRLSALGRNIADVIANTRLTAVMESGRPEIGDIQHIGNDVVVATNRVPVVVDGKVMGAVATYQDVTEVQRVEQKIRTRLLEKGFVAKYSFDDIVHRSAAMAECIRTARKFSAYEASVLISGPSGVGKELFAQSMHNASPRRNMPFVAINCAALPETLIESELFGYVEGSFTGAARKGKAGLFEMAHGGTIFLDEISELPYALQGRLLRVLQEKQVMRLGDNKLVPIDVRVICASNRDLRDLLRQNLFRTDLYFRIAFLNLFLPPLNDRIEDLEPLCAHFVDVLSRQYRKGAVRLGGEAFAFLQRHNFQGNVRELHGMLERAMVVCDGGTIGVADLTAVAAESGPYCSIDRLSFPVSGHTLRDVEQSYIRHVYQTTNGSIKECSAILGIDRTTLWRHLRKQSMA